METKLNKMQDALETIMLNTLHREFDDKLYKSMVLSTIEIALGKEEFEKLEKLYSYE